MNILNMIKWASMLVTLTVGCSTNVPANESTNDGIVCKELFSSGCTEYDTACNGEAVCKCGYWMAKETAKNVGCSPSAPPASDAAPTSDVGRDAPKTGASPSDAGIPESGTEASVSTDSASVDSPTDVGETSTDSGTVGDSAPADTFVAETTVADTGTAADSAPADTFVADTFVADTGTVADTTPPTSGVGTLKVSILLPRWGATHPITVYSYVHATGGAPSPGKWTATGRGIDVTTDAVSGSDFVFNGFYDPKTTTSDDWTNAFCDPKLLTPKVAMWASFNGKPTARVAVIPNFSGGCNLKVVAIASPLISTSDKDGDGFPSTTDCDDDPATGHRRFPGQIETPEDDVDLDCNGINDPPRAVIRMMGVSSGASPFVYDVLRWGTTFPMAWDSASGSYQTSPLEMEIAPREFFINWAGGGWDSSYEGYCVEKTGGVVMFHDTDKTLIPVTLKVASSGTTCHRYADF